MAKGPSAETCAAVDERDLQCCVRCGRHIDGGSRHHRKLRRFDDHSVENLILLCGSGTTGCHGWVHANVAASYEQGWLVHSWNTPALVPVRYGRRWVLLTPEGDIMNLSDDDARKRMISSGVIS